ncbi:MULTISPECIES: hypothetical protein [Glycomyces]|uniref:DUF4399 domain-containing protein n=2 Tax=Glycomyces lechevalierae TaxID=256034 RepID=A0A9X3ST44_9ACTN|nr:hypothetical protein [Glycomyces lechevalierae]MDA1383805.1 hypothetical protein [Glycomyces lechevalierae]MDR7341202.1 hypothetical protein [Glycomyces lechevalierae]
MLKRLMSKGLMVPFALGALFLAACGGGGYGDGGGSGGGSGDGPTVTIETPSDGDTLDTPFKVVVDSSEDLGPTDSGNDHVHLYFDDNDSAYAVIDSGNGEAFEVAADSPALDGIDPGEHTLHVSLRNADHSAAGAEDEVTVTIGDGSGGGSDNGGGGGY